MVVFGRVLLAVFLHDVHQQQVVLRCEVLHASIVPQLALDHGVLREIYAVVVLDVFIYLETQLQFFCIAKHISFL